MLRDQKWLSPAEGLEVELEQCLDEGLAVGDAELVRGRIAAIAAIGGPERERAAAALLDELAGAPARGDYPFREPSDLDSIRRERPAAASIAPAALIAPSVETNYDRIHAAWLGRCAGCLLGQPVEGWRRGRIQGFLSDTGNFPIRRYMSSAVPEPVRRRWEVADKAKVYGASHRNWINNVSYMPEDDDTNYTVIALKLLEDYGPDFTPDDAAECWLMNLPILHLCTAERAAYRNLVNRVYPPASAAHRNPYREWIGAQIRADLFGYVAPGDPELAAGLAWRDASISHVKNGIYGEMWAAAMLAAAGRFSDGIEPEAVIRAGLGQIPARSRLAAGLEEILEWKRLGLSAGEAIDAVHRGWNEDNKHHWCHTIPNAMIVALALIWGGPDFGRVVGLAVEAGFDTDCNAATAGSVFGMLHGTAGLPAAWTAPLGGRLRSGVDGFGLVEIEELARRTLRLAERGVVQRPDARYNARPGATS